jgi:N-acetylneuraminic acid mutarotase
MNTRHSLAHLAFVALLLSGGRAAVAADSMPPAAGQPARRVVRAALGDTTKIGARPSDARTAAAQSDSWTATTMTGAPSARALHTAVWTGSRMIVWGGDTYFYNASSGGYWLGPYFNDGGQYDPVANAWTATTITNAPSRRNDHTAVWTGSRMIVWGGDDSVDPGTPDRLNDGGQYDPVGDTWTATTTAGAPSARAYHTAVWTGSRMIVWGGNSNTGNLNDGGQYDPVGNTWTATTTTGAPSPRSGHTAVWTGTRMIVWGSQQPSSFGHPLGSFLNDGGQYDPVGNTWTATTITNAPSGRADQTAVWTGSRMIVWGGNNFTGYLNDGGQYDPVGNTWTATTAAGAPSARVYHTAVWTGTKMVVWGGDNLVVGAVNDGGQYDPVANAWTATTITNAPSGRAHQTAVWTGSKMIVWGGTGEGADVILRDGGQWSPGTASGCTEDALTLCLIGGRYKVTSYWRDQYAGGATANLSKAHLTDATGAFWLSDANTYEYLIRINTATNNGRAWIAIPTFTDVEFWIQVQDTINGQAQTYHSPAGNKTLIYDPYFFMYP